MAKRKAHLSIKTMSTRVTGEHNLSSTKEKKSELFSNDTVKP